MPASIFNPPGPAPVIASGFGGATGRTITGNGRAFTIVCGNNGTDTSGVLTLPAALNGWSVFAANQTTARSAGALGGFLVQTGGTTTAVTLHNYDVTGSDLVFASGDVLKCIAEPY